MRKLLCITALACLAIGTEAAAPPDTQKDHVAVSAVIGDASPALATMESFDVAKMNLEYRATADTEQPLPDLLAEPTPPGVAKPVSSPNERKLTDDELTSLKVRRLNPYSTLERRVPTVDHQVNSAGSNRHV